MALPLASRFFTFYSFKGGVGRSMALLNCAYVLAGYGRRVLMIDLDLEAPGLSFLIQRREAKKKSATAKHSKGNGTKKFEKGMVELIGEFIQDPEGWPLAQVENAQLLETYVSDLVIPKSVRAQGAKGRLGLMPAGRLDEQYESRLASIHWAHEPLASHRDDLFRHLRNMLVALDAFDYVLIDSRTGWSDEGYISARILADHLIVLTALNDQNIIGTSRFLKQVEGWPQPENSPKRRAVLVESPVPEWEEQAKHDRHKEVQQLFKRETGNPVKFSLALPYNPRIALREEALVADWPDTSLSVAYRQLTATIQGLAEDTATHWLNRARGAMRPSAIAPEAHPSPPDLDSARDALTYLRPLDSTIFDLAARQISDQLISATVPIAGDVKLMRYFASCFPDDPSYSRNTATLLAARRQLTAANRELDKAEDIATRQQNQSERLQVSAQRANLAREAWDLDRARDAYIHTLSVARELGEQRANAFALHSLAELDRLQGDYQKARRGYEESLEIYRAIGDQRGIGVTLHPLAELDRLQGDYQKARRGYEESLEIKRALGDQRGIGATLHSLADLDRLQGDYQKARRGYEESLEIVRALGDQRGIGITLHSLADLDRLQGDYQKARRGYEESLEIVRALGDQRGIGITLHSLAELDRLQGNYQKARRGYEESLEISRALGDQRGIGATLMYQESSAILAGESRSTSKLSKHVANVAKFGDSHLTVRGHLLVAEGMIELGDSEGGAEKLLDSIRTSDKHGLNGLKAEGQAQLAILLGKTGDSSGAARTAKDAIQFFDSQSVRHPQRKQLDRIASARKPRRE